MGCSWRWSLRESVTSGIELDHAPDGTPAEGGVVKRGDGTPAEGGVVKRGDGTPAEGGVVTLEERETSAFLALVV